MKIGDLIELKNGYVIGWLTCPTESGRSLNIKKTFSAIKKIDIPNIGIYMGKLPKYVLRERYWSKLAHFIFIDGKIFIIGRENFKKL